MNDLQDQIKAFIQGRLSESTRETFVQKINSDPELAQEVKVFESMYEAIEIGIAQDTRSYLHGILNDQSKPGSGLLRFWWILSLLFLFGLGAALIWAKTNIEQQSYREYAMVDPKTFGIRGSNQEYLQSFLQAYHEKDLNKAALYADSLSQEGYDRYPDLLLLQADLHKKKKQYSEAEKLYDQAIAIPKSRDKALLQKLYFYAKTKQETKYQQLNAQLQSETDYIFEEERAQIEALHDSQLKRWLY